MKPIGRIAAAAGLIIGLAQGIAATSAPVIQWHFSGTTAALAANPEATWNQLLESKSAGVLFSQIRGRTADWLPSALGWPDKGFMAGTPTLRPFIDDVVLRESVAHVGGDSLQSGDWVFAIRLDPEGQDRWSRGLLNLARQMKLSEPQALTVRDAGKGWRLPATGKFGGFGFVLVKDWLVASSDVETNPTAVAWLGNIARSGSPAARENDELLTLALRPTAVGLPLELPAAGPIERLAAAFAWQGESLRMDSNVTLEREFQYQKGEWKIPTNVIRDPLVSFTAVRGISDWLDGLKAVAPVPSRMKPDQAVFWSRSDVAFLYDVAVPVSNGREVFGILEKTIPLSYNDTIMEYSLGRWLSLTNESRLLWKGLPVFVPYLYPTNDHGQDYLIGGLFPLISKPDQPAAPEALFDQVRGRDDLVYYDWEITAARLDAFKQTERFLSLLVEKRPVKEGSSGKMWADTIAPMLKNSVTEVTQTGPKSLRITRKSSMGLTGIEVWWLTQWVDGDSFPASPYYPPKKRGVPGADSGRTFPAPNN